MIKVKGPFRFTFRGTKFYVSMYRTGTYNTTQVSIFKNGRLDRRYRSELTALAFSFLSDPSLDDVSFHWFEHRRAVLCNTDHENYFIAICEEDENV